MLKKCLFLFLLSFLIIFPAQSSFAQAEVEKTTVYIFSTPTCPHCTSAKNFLRELQNQEGVDFSVRDYDISRNSDIAESFYKQYSVPSSRRGLVPAIFVGDKYFVGFGQSTEKELRDYLTQEQPDSGAVSEEIDDDKEKREMVSLPIFGEVNLFSFSLPVLAITLGIVDGFNVCSLGALIIILGLVMTLRSRRRIFLFGGAFLATTAVIYGILIFLWHQFFSFIAPHIRSMEILIGFLALGGGIYLLREFYRAYKLGPVCSSNNIMSRLTPKIEKVFQSGAGWLAVLGAVMVFATVVTVVEFPCSAVLPVIFTSILVDSGVAFSTVVFYIALYMFFYLLDEAIIFLIAVLTLNIKIVSPRFIIAFNLLAALIFIFLGAYYLFGWIS